MKDERLGRREDKKKRIYTFGREERRGKRHIRKWLTRDEKRDMEIMEKSAEKA